MALGAENMLKNEKPKTKTKTNPKTLSKFEDLIGFIQ